jgi:ribosomal protein L1
MLPRCAFSIAYSTRSAFRGAERQFTAAAAAATQAPPASAESTASKVPRKPRPTEKYVDPVNINDAFGIVKKHAWARFDETVEAIVGLDVDPRKPNQSIKGVAQLPNGNGKKVVVAVFAKDSDQKAALDAGADIVGAEDLIARVQAGDIPFQRAIATPEMMSALSKIGKVC